MPKLRSGTVIVVGLLVVMGLGWLLYRPFIPPRWMHDFASEIAARATPDPDAPPPRDTREATPRVTPEHPYICFARLIPFAWDHLYVLPSGGDPENLIAAAHLTWPGDSAADLGARMHRDPRYQLLVLTDAGRVVASGLFYTFWGDLSALARAAGFTPDEAVFTAEVKHGTHVLHPVEPPPPICRGAS